MIKVAIVDDEVLFRKGITLMIEDMEGIEAAFEASNGQELIDELQNRKGEVDIVLLDLNMPVKDGVETSKEMRTLFPEIKVIVLSTHFNKAFVMHMLDLGVSSYLAKDTDPQEFENSIREIEKNGFYYSPEILKFIQENFNNKSKKEDRLSLTHSLAHSFTSRELEVLELICNQYKTSEIGKKLFISPRTVEGHRNNLLSKTGCRNTAGLVAYAIQKQLVKIHDAPNFS